MEFVAVLLEHMKADLHVLLVLTRTALTVPQVAAQSAAKDTMHLGHLV